MKDDKDIIQRDTVEQMVSAYQSASDEIKQAYKLLEQATKRLRASFGESLSSLDAMPDRGCYTEKDAQKKIKMAAWKSIIYRLEIKKIMSIKDSDNLDNLLEKPDSMPDITVNAIMDTLSTIHQTAPEYAHKLAIEVFEILTPGRRSSHYKTNVQNARKALGRKIIIPYKVEHDYSGGFRVPYGKTQEEVTAIDKVFFALDGKGIPGGYLSPLVDAINTSGFSGIGETEYFKFRACANRNLHLEFKRLDLVRQLNQIAGVGNFIAD